MFADRFGPEVQRIIHPLSMVLSNGMKQHVHLLNTAFNREVYSNMCSCVDIYQDIIRSEKRLQLW